MNIARADYSAFGSSVTSIHGLKVTHSYYDEDNYLCLVQISDSERRRVVVDVHDAYCGEVVPSHLLVTRRPETGRPSPAIHYHHPVKPPQAMSVSIVVGNRAMSDGVDNVEVGNARR